MFNRFNIYEHIKPTNQDIIVTFKPNANATHYTYKIYRDNELNKTIDINNNHPVDIQLSTTGQYKIEIIEFYQNKESNIIVSGEYNIDKEKPVLVVGEKKLDMPIGATLDLLGDVRAFDKQDGDLINKVTTNYGELDLQTPGIKTLVYTVSDQAGNTATASVYINVYNANYESVLLIQYIIMFLILVLIFLIHKFRRSMRLEKRISEYSIVPILDNSLSLFDKLIMKYTKVIKKISDVLCKSVFLKKYSRRFDKYVGVINGTYESGLNFLVEKIVVAVLFFIVAAFSEIIQYRLINTYVAFLPLFVGYLMPNLVYYMSYKRHRKKIENDFLQAVTVMNNAFKSGRSIIQAIELVTVELDGPISKEFKKMQMEINLGLSIDVVFDRFTKRIQLEEASYLTVSLTILSKSGGNIIKVFSSIEKTLFNKKKLELELKALTSGTKIIVSILLTLPLFFVLIIHLINPGYFYPLYSTKIGGLLIAVMLIIYSTYIYIVQKIIRVRM